MQLEEMPSWKMGNIKEHCMISQQLLDFKKRRQNITVKKGIIIYDYPKAKRKDRNHILYFIY